MVGRSSRPHLPIILPGGDMLPHMSARRRHEIMDTAFEMVGGVERLAHEMNKNTEGYWAGMQLWAKGLPRAVATEHSVNTDSVEKFWDKLDAREKEKKDANAPAVVEAEFTDVTPED